MKTLIRIFLILILGFFLLGAGFYITLNNIGRLLTTTKPQWQFRRLASGLLIKTGNWQEKVDLRPPLQVTRRANYLILHSHDLTITVNTKPNLRIKWKKNLAGRRSNANGEY